jgi:hypothetical protein
MQLTVINGSTASPLLATCTSILQTSGRVSTGPGVVDAAVVVTGAGVAVAMVSTAVGTGVATGVAGCVQPAATSRRTRTTKRENTHLVFIHTHLFEKYLSVMGPGKKRGR